MVSSSRFPRTCAQPRSQGRSRVYNEERARSLSCHVRRNLLTSPVSPTGLEIARKMRYVLEVYVDRP
ncbi:hypothetical protein BD309DRAFT_970569 [Dichomitus squalens]|uniref:Uncharacterized protein n=1 Tax=Dichomitus squalens TaxID=114155 RepID=A0A4V2K828_9APHY|nr:hypothetical protein BD309DRAFT_970569 [Dichomitus squalens]TBU58438.1 hypothetical protein BD310DRAFT_927310 [Dichomitus squalens]